MQIHNLAQAAHCAAQGKVGSGFDVAAAVFGSCVYRRFTPGVLEEVGDAGSAGFGGRLRKAVDTTWDLEVGKKTVPKGLRIVMGDVDCGSSTPGMVRKVLAWRKEKGEEAEKVWREIQSANKGLIELFEKAEEVSGTVEYAEALKAYAAGEEGVGGVLGEIERQIGVIRKLIREMGEAAGVEIEPPTQTKLLDEGVASAKGVLGGVVPGAGGYDAVVFLVVDNDETVSNLKAFLASYSFGGEGSSRVTALGTREEHQGVKQEDPTGY